MGGLREAVEALAEEWNQEADRLRALADSPDADELREGLMRESGALRGTAIVLRFILAAHPATPDTEPRAREDASGAGEVELTDAEASRIVSASISPDRVLSGNNPKGETPDVLLVVVRDILATRLAAATGARDADVAARHEVVHEHGTELVCSCGTLLSNYGLTRTLHSLWAEHIATRQAIKGCQSASRGEE